jgi:hypothetical protein
MSLLNAAPGLPVRQEISMNPKDFSQKARDQRRCKAAQLHCMLFAMHIERKKKEHHDRAQSYTITALRANILCPRPKRTHPLEIGTFNAVGIHILRTGENRTCNEVSLRHSRNLLAGMTRRELQRMFWKVQD